MIEVKMLVDLYDEDEESDEPKLIKEDVIVRKLTRVEGLYPEEVLKKDGSVYKDRVRVYDDTTRDSYVIQGSYNSLKKLVNTKRKIIGY
jgi:hypothetical protein